MFDVWHRSGGLNKTCCPTYGPNLSIDFSLGAWDTSVERDMVSVNMDIGIAISLGAWDTSVERDMV